jgi:hypothetical protein
MARESRSAETTLLSRWLTRGVSRESATLVPNILTRAEMIDAYSEVN